MDICTPFVDHSGGCGQSSISLANKDPKQGFGEFGQDRI